MSFPRKDGLAYRELSSTAGVPGHNPRLPIPLPHRTATPECLLRLHLGLYLPRRPLARDRQACQSLITPRGTPSWGGIPIHTVARLVRMPRRPLGPWWSPTSNSCCPAPYSAAQPGPTRRHCILNRTMGTWCRRVKDCRDHSRSCPGAPFCLVLHPLVWNWLSSVGQELVAGKKDVPLTNPVISAVS